MSTAENVELMRRYWPEANAHGLLSIVDHYVATDVISHPPASASPAPLVGLAAYKRFVTDQFYGVFPDLQTTVHDLVADGDLVGLRVTAAGTHTGSLMGAPPTGRRVSFSGMELFRLRDGRIVEQWGEIDAIEMLQQLGLMPASDVRPTAAEAQARNGQTRPASREENAATVRDFHERFNQHDLSGVGALCDDVVIHHGAQLQDLATALRFADSFLDAFADGRNEIHAMLADDNAVLTRGVFKGQHNGDFMGVPPTGRQVTMTWMTFDRMHGGRIAERWAEQDTLGLLQQLGPLAPPSAAKGELTSPISQSS